MVNKESSADLLGVSEKDTHADEEFELKDLIDGLESADCI